MDEHIKQIIAINHAWKRQRDIFDANDAIPLMLQRRKASLQVELLRRFSNDVYLRIADDNQEDGEPLYSVRLRVNMPLGGVIRKDAEHMPVRIAEEFLTATELTNFVQG